MSALGLCGDSVPDRPRRPPPCRAAADRAFLYFGAPPLGVRVELRCASCPGPSRRWWTRLPLAEASVHEVMDS